MTVTVYLETSRPKYAEIAAKFSSEELYEKCLPMIEEFAKENNFDLVTESIDEEENL